MAWIESLIRRTGEDVPIHRETEGGLGAYGDPTSTWAVTATERMLITRPKPSYRDSIAGRIDDTEFWAYLLVASVVKGHDYLIPNDGAKYEVINVDNVTKRGTVFGKKATLKRMDEGA